ncbi:MAG: YkgJ family cysteine cluster protein [Planctomycetota bacterium]
MKVTAENVAKMAERKLDENHELRQYLKFQDRLSEEELDQLVSDIARKVWARFDCADCGNCCKETHPGVTEADAQRLARGLGLSVEEFRDRYLSLVADPDDLADTPWEMDRLPCPFLKDNRCVAYEHRPAECRHYPYLDEPAFSYRTLGMLERSFTCPVVYLVLEELKAVLPFRPGRSR